MAGEGGQTGVVGEVDCRGAVAGVGIVLGGSSVERVEVARAGEGGRFGDVAVGHF